MQVITRVAGTIDTSGSGGDDGPATDAQLNSPFGVAATPDGGYLIADSVNHVIRKVSPEGLITRVAGTAGVSGDTGDGGPATDATLHNPLGVADTGDGGFLIADTFNAVVRQVSPDGVITRVAGTGVSGSAGDGGPATDAQLLYPVSVAVTADGGFLIVDAYNYVVRKVSSAGVITRVAGTLEVLGSAGDDGAATDAELDTPLGVAVTADGGFLIADTFNHVVRKVSATGVITRVAGTLGVSGSSGDDGLATSAKLHQPFGVAETADGGFLISDWGNVVVRKVSPAGVISRAAGVIGTVGSSGDDGPATVALLNTAFGMAVTADGGFLFADRDNHVIRRVS
jgi:hypothetical protein